MSFVPSALVAPAPRLSVRTQTLAAIVAVVAAVALPQVFHQAGVALGVGAALGRTLLPMHLPVIVVGLLAGPAAGAVTGAAAPLVSCALSGMPAVATLPFMVVELAAYGAVAGALRSIKLPTLAKVLVTQVAGRVVLTAATVVAVAALGAEQSVAAIWTTTLAAGVAGLAVQWIAVPLVVGAVNRIVAAEKRDE